MQAAPPEHAENSVSANLPAPPAPPGLGPALLVTPVAAQHPRDA